MSASFGPIVLAKLASETIIIPDMSGGLMPLGALLTSTGATRCTGVLLYSPANDGIYTDNTLPIMIGGPQIGAAVGYPLLPGEVIQIQIGDTNDAWIFEPTNSGTQILVVTVSL